MTVFLDGEDITPPAWDRDMETPEPAEYLLLLSGRVIIEPPDSGMKLRASYYFQWFTDDELASFLGQAAGLLSFDGVADGSLTVQLRTPLISFAAHYAYLKMAALSAQSLVAGAGGFTADNSKEHPNWMGLAALAWETATKELTLINSDPVASSRPAMRFVSFRLARYVPRS